MKRLLIVEVILNDANQVQFNVDGHVDPHTAIGFLERTKNELLNGKGLLPTVGTPIPGLNPKKF